MNIIKIQDMLRSVPDNALIGYVQNPQGEVPSYLALSELQRRKDTRAKYQQQQTPESSVAEDLGQETAQADQGGLAMLAGQPPQDMAEQGVAGLDTGDMYNEENFAGGGIVAFDGRQGSYVSSDPRPYYYGEDEEEATSPIGRLFNYLDVSGRVKKSDFGKRREERKKIDKEIQETVPTLIGGKRGFFDQETKAQQREYDQRRRELEALKSQSPFFAPEPGGAVYDKKEAVDPTMKSYIEQEKAQAAESKKNPYKPLSDKEKENIKKQFGYDDTKGNAPAQQPAESDEDYLRRRMALYKEFMGPNEDRTKLQDKIDAMEKRAARQEEMAPWMALTEAGFKTMAGTSPFALTNLGAGAEAGIKSYGAAQDKMASLEEKRYALMNEAAKADRAEKQAIVKFGFDSEEAKANRDQKERLGQEELKIRREANRLTNDFNKARLNASSEKGLLKSQAEQMIKVNKDIDAQLAYLATAPKSEKITAMINSLLARKAENEAHVKSIYTNLKNPGLADTTFKSSDFTVEELTGQ
jgi:hypothetical protein